MLIFSFRPPIYKFTKETASEIHQKLSDFKNNQISRDMAEEELAKKITPEHAREILDNINTWD
jgi:hypothetical protein